MVKFEEFKKMELVIGAIKQVKDHPNADKLYVLTVDIGGEERQMVAGVKQYYKPEELEGRRVACITNLEPATIRGVESQGMVLASKDDKTLSILTPDREVQVGTKIT